ncbi:hypothetical protein CL615_00955 [archaeon]|jgi:amidophosphoribosyltransferase|nr:hypothetical protein [archaeon]|tara:strand:- start:10576 stop:12288 length:1713 start_codon:yes stop_codon:yes gene_type:complete
MCGVCGAYILDHDTLNHEGKLDIAGALNTLKGIDGERLVDKGATAAGVLYYFLTGLVNRGPDSTGMVIGHDNDLKIHKRMGIAKKAYTQKILENMVGDFGTGHDRYATIGLPRKQNIQPFIDLDVAVSHNGNLTNQKEQRDMIIKEEKRIYGGSDLTSATDSELIPHKISLEKFTNRAESKSLKELDDIISNALVEFRGAYSITGMIDESIFAARDPYGRWPLFWAVLDNLVLFSSERQPIMNFIRDSNYQLGVSSVKKVQPGEIILVNEDNIYSSLLLMEKYFSKYNIKIRKIEECSFDYSYIRSHKDENIQDFRKIVGGILSDSLPKDLDYIVPVPNSGMYYGVGLSEKSGIEIKELIGISEKYKNNPTRTFQKSSIKERQKAIKKKYAFNQDDEYYHGKKIALTDDTIVRNLTMFHNIKKLRLKGVSEIHARIGTPAVVTPCFYGVHHLKEEMIAYRLDKMEVEKYFESIFYGVDYKSEALISKIKKGKSIRKIVEESVKDRRNYLKDKKMREVKDGQFSLEYISHMLYRKAFTDSGLNPDTKCYACQIHNYQGYRKEVLPDIRRAE